MSGWENLAQPSKRPWNLTRWKLAGRFIQVSNYDSQNTEFSVEIWNSKVHRESQWTLNQQVPSSRGEIRDAREKRRPD